ncbi:MAG: hypothetical protein NWE93_04405 [Candidatus Bathyarchaeota archaeon]|nr:hypothetical protein [Candidatus Bathyarchaeota archaeon]
MQQANYKCPFCDEAPAWRTRYMLWKHMHQCLQRLKQVMEGPAPIVPGYTKEFGADAGSPAVASL